MPTIKTEERINIGYYPTTHIERKPPQRLAKLMSDMEWTVFCNHIDSHLEPLDSSIKTTNFITILGLLLIVVISISLVLLVESDQGGQNDELICYVIVAIFFLFVFIIFMFKWCTKILMTNIFKEIQYEICNKVSETKKNNSLRIRFHVHTEYDMCPTIWSKSGMFERDFFTSYIQVEIVEKFRVESCGHMIESCDPMVAITKKVGNTLSTAERLQELETIKHLLSPTEYEDKRADIIAKV